MPKVAILCIALLLSAAGPAAAECPKPTADALAGGELDAQLTLSVKDSDLLAAFNEVANAAQLRFNLDGLRPTERPETLEVSNMSARAVLGLMERNLNLKYRQQAGTIEVTPAEHCTE